MSHIANPYIKKQSNAGCWTGKPLRRASETGMQTKSRAPGTGSFLLPPLSPALRLYAQNLQYIQAVYPHRRCIEHKAHCQGISSFLFSPVLLRGCFLMEAAPLSSFYGPRKGLLCMFTRMAVFTVPLRRWPRAGAAPWRLRRPLPSAHRLQWQCPRPAPLPC